MVALGLFEGGRLVIGQFQLERGAAPRPVRPP
jgi:hypothetical protein